MNKLNIIWKTAISLGVALGLILISNVCEGLQQQIEQNAQDIKTTQEMYANINKDIKDLDKDIKTLEKKMGNNQEEINKLKNKVKTIKWTLQKRGNNAPTFNNISNEELDLLYRVVYAEAGVEPYEGQVAVAQVILNRVKDERFPNTITGVVYQKHQFEVVANKMLYDRTPSETTKRAVHDALNGKNVIGDCIGFWAIYLDRNTSLWELSIKHKIGGHVFTNEY